MNISSVLNWTISTSLDNVLGDMDIRNQVIIHTLQALEREGFNMPSKIIELKNHQDSPLKTSEN